jgi:L-lactate dehydrogenase complex protein LldF
LGRQALRCIRCSACLNVCPVYERTGGHAYGGTYPGPIGAVLTPQLVGVKHASTLPFASSLCGACFEVCPVEIDIPSVLVKLRRDVVTNVRHVGQDALFAAAGVAMGGPRRWARVLRFARLIRIAAHLPIPAISRWSRVRELPVPPAKSFRDWWVEEHSEQPGPDAKERL